VLESTRLDEFFSRHVYLFKYMFKRLKAFDNLFSAIAMITSGHSRDMFPRLNISQPMRHDLIRS
jgi:hypothetical protein